MDSENHGFAQHSMKVPVHIDHNLTLLMELNSARRCPWQAYSPHCTELHGPPLAQICTDKPKFPDARMCTENVQQEPQMHRIARIPCSCLVIFTCVHVTAREFPDVYIYMYILGSSVRVARAVACCIMLRIYYGITLQKHITGSYYSIILQN